MQPEILLDLSRLIWSADRKTPTGIERVELVHALHLIGSAGSRFHFSAITPWRGLGLLSRSTAVRFIKALDQLWRSGDAGSSRQVVRLARKLKRSLVPGTEAALSDKMGRVQAPIIYLLLSHHHLDRPELIERIKARTGARFVALIHDIIPLHYPEYGRPGEAKRHAKRMETVARLADGIIHNSASTQDMFQPFLNQAERDVPSIVAHLGIHLPHAPTFPVPGEIPSFVYIGTVEPRKNHLLLLHLWRRFAEMRLNLMPKLVIIGRRGWENENIVDMLERCAAIHPHIEEHSDLADEDVLPLLASARALLLPSFAEGYGLPLAEALGLGVPALCSDLPALREIGGDVPEYLDPLDGVGWQAAILDYTQPDSHRRRAQLDRLAGWSPPLWDTHLTLVDGLLETVARGVKPLPAARR